MLRETSVERKPWTSDLSTFIQHVVITISGIYYNSNAKATRGREERSIEIRLTRFYFNRRGDLAVFRSHARKK